RPNRWLVERQKQKQLQNLPLKGDSSQRCFPVSSVVSIVSTNLAMLTHRQGWFVLDRTFALIEGHPHSPFTPKADADGAREKHALAQNLKSETRRHRLQRVMPFSHLGRSRFIHRFPSTTVRNLSPAGSSPAAPFFLSSASCLSRMSWSHSVECRQSWRP